MKERTVADVMTRVAITVRANAGLKEAVRLMDVYNVRGLPVVDSSGAVVGVISTTDVIHEMAEATR